MNYSKISVRYARALFELAKEKGLSEKIREDLNLILLFYGESSDFRLIISSPVIKSSKKKEIFHALFRNRLNPITLSFIDLVIKNRRESNLSDIARGFSHLYKREADIKSVKLTLPVEIDESLQQKLQEMIQSALSSNIELEKQINADILGGFIIQIEDQLLDASVSAKLRNIKKELINK